MGLIVYNQYKLLRNYDTWNLKERKMIETFLLIFTSYFRFVTRATSNTIKGGSSAGAPGAHPLFEIFKGLVLKMLTAEHAYTLL